MARIRILSGDLQGQTFDLSQDHITIGRATDNDIVIDEGQVESHHAAIEMRDGWWILCNLVRGASTSINGRFGPFDGERLSNGDRIQIGPLQMQIELGPVESFLQRCSDFAPYAWLMERWWGNLACAAFFLGCSVLFFLMGYFKKHILLIWFPMMAIYHVVMAGITLKSTYAKAGARNPENIAGMIVIGYILAVLFPLIGFIFGLYLLFCRNRIGHFFALFVLSLFFTAFWVALWAELQPQPVQYWWVEWWYEIRWW